MISTLAFAFVRIAVISALTLAAMPLLSRAPASVRRFALAVALGVCLVAPLASVLAPAPLLPSSMVDLARAPFAEPLETVSTPASVVERAAGRAAPSLGAPSASPEAVVIAVWAAIAFVLASRLVIARVRAARLGRGGVELEPGVFVTSDTDAPVVAGTFSSRVLLPPAALEWESERLAVVLAHERAHVAARDGLVRLLADLACAIHWPVPTVWMLSRRLSRECELAADEHAVRAGFPSATVAEHLVAVAQEALSPSPAATFGMASELERRVGVLLEARPSTWSRGACGFAVVVLATTCGLLACVGKTEPKSLVPSSAEAARARSDAPSPAGGQADGTAKSDLSRLVDEERARMVGELGAEGGVVIVADARSHAVLAASGDVDTPRVPGSTVKPLLVAAALEAGVVDEKTSLDCGNGYRMYGARKLSDASPHGALDLASVLAVSSNVGASRVADALGRERTLRAFASVGLGAGIPAKVDDGFELAVVASGEGLRATPRALVAAYGTLVDGTFEGHEVLRPTTAARVRSMLEEVVYAKEGTGGRAAVPSVRVAGKTGTSRNGPDLYSSFVGFLPASEPRYVIYVGVDAPRDDAPGGKAAAPVFARIASRLLAR